MISVLHRITITLTETQDKPGTHYDVTVDHGPVHSPNSQFSLPYGTKRPAVTRGELIYPSIFLWVICLHLRHNVRSGCAVPSPAAAWLQRGRGKSLTGWLPFVRVRLAGPIHAEGRRAFTKNGAVERVPVARASVAQTWHIRRLQPHPEARGITCLVAYVSLVKQSIRYLQRLTCVIAHNAPWNHDWRYFKNLFNQLINSQISSHKLHCVLQQWKTKIKAYKDRSSTKFVCHVN